MSAAALVLAAGLAIAPSLRSELIFHVDGEETGPPLADRIAGIEADESGFGHLYGQPGPAGFGMAVGLEENGSWQFTELDSAVLRSLANDFSVAAWVYIDSVTALFKEAEISGALNRIIGDDEEWDADGWSFGVWNDGRVRFTKNGIIDIDLGAPGAVAQDEWVHVAATVSSTTGTTLYVNGVAVGTNGNLADINTGPGNDGFDNLYGVGRSYGGGQGQWVGGFMDDIRVYDEVLTANQIAALMVPPRDPALQASATFDATVNGAATLFELPLDNTGDTQNLVVSGVTFTLLEGTDGAFSVSALPDPIAPGATGTLRLAFDTDAPGRQRSVATLATNDPELPTFAVTLTVDVREPWVVVDNALAFDPLPSGTPPMIATLTISNAGAETDLTVTPGAITGPEAARFSVQSAPGPIAAGGEGELAIRFDPMGQRGRFNAELTLATNDSGAPSIPIALSAEVGLDELAQRLVSHFTFDDPANVGADSGAFRNNGTPMGDAQFTPDAQVGGGALLLDGDGDYVSVGGMNDYGGLAGDGDGFTLAAWVNLSPTAPNGVMRIFSTDMTNGFTGNGWGAGFASLDNLIATTYGRWDYTSDVATAPLPDEWRHLAFVYRNNPIDTIDFYVDGVLVTSALAGGPTGITGATADFIIGGLALSTALQWFDGRIDDLRIYDIELDADQIGSILDPGPGTPFVITDFTFDPTAGEAVVTWNSEPGSFYAIFRSTTDLAAGSWEELDDSLESAGTSTTFTDESVPTESGRVYYHVRRVQ